VIKLEEEGFFFIIYGKKMQRRPQLELRFPSIKATPYLVLRGKKAARIFNIISQLLSTYKLKERVWQEGENSIIQVPMVSGLCITVYVILTYTTNSEERYIDVLEQMIQGEFPLIRRFVDFINLALELSDHVKQRGNSGSKRQLVSPNALRVVSKVMRLILHSLDGSTVSDKRRDGFKGIQGGLAS